MRRTIKAYISHGETHYVAECLEIPVVTQGRTLDETMANLEEAVALFLEGEDLAALDLAPNPSLLVTGTLRAIIRQASRYIPESELRPHFYTA